MQEINIHTEYIKLDQLLKWANIADSGAFAKLIIQNGDVKVNGEVVLSRGKKIYKGDIIEVNGVGSFKVV
ncbi:RNA-binding S4 domain-containing protein [Thermobrachium celere]|uniref:RNA-binding S4 domain-containing protein n=1 Tax=Thermobrachium celere DSM 8682 TaxID=941824 RepID=R7RUA7_9CLOT|nr:RNA-binding S4 domain-containing protein [Thermobrachium celere]GFR35082.1 RNA-binding protein [Thermobrachium celere]CDF58958.1 FIG002958: hypothetical protein [Thermobrachium celere DSM 8682]